MFLSWILTAIPLLVQFDTGNSGFPQPQTPSFYISGKSSKVDPKLERVVKSTKTPNLDQGTFVTSNRSYFMSSTTCVLALLVNGFATFTLPVELQKESALVPSLQSNWLIMHVTVMMASYATLMVGSLLAFFVLLTSEPNHKEASVKETIVMEILNLVNKAKQLLWVTTNKNGERSATLANNRTQSGLPNLPQTISAEKNLLSSTEQLKLILPSQMLYKDDSFSIQENSFGFESKASEKLPLTKASWPEDLHFATDDKSISVSRAEVLDSLSYRTLGVGFPLLTIGILSGAVWANQAWGSYWSWDPKETWAFITWLVFAIYFHTRLSKGWTGKQSAFVACIGFVDCVGLLLRGQFTRKRAS